MLLTRDNFGKGFLIDEELMGGITEDPSQPNPYTAFVLRHTTGEYLGYQAFPTLDEALGVLNAVQRAWTFERTSGCGNDQCGKAGKCSGTGCKIGRQKQAEGGDQTGTESGSGCSTC